MIPCEIVGTGSALPPECIDNATLSARLGFNIPAEQIWRKTGIRTRHWAPPGTTSASLGAEALTRALEMAGMQGSDLRRLIHMSSSCGDDLSPCTASGVAGLLGLRHLDCYDINNACGAFLWGLDSAARGVATGVGPIAIIATELTSDIVDRTDPRTSLIFGDASGAAILVPTSRPRGIEGYALHTDPGWGNTVVMRHPRNTGAPTHISFEIGNDTIVDNAVQLLKEAVTAALADAGCTLDDIDHVIPHQPNGRMLDRILDGLGVPHERTLRVCDRIGSTGCASLPFGLDRIVRERGVEEGDRLLFTSIGGGVSYGAIVLRAGALGAPGTKNDRQ